MPLHTIENSGAKVLELEVNGKFVASDFQNLESKFQRLVKQHGKIRVLFIMRDFHGWAPTAFWDEVKFDVKHLSDIERLALVGDKQWEKFLGAFGRPFTAAEIRYFDSSALAEARAWIERDSV
jgi:hypothetical protein